MELFVSVTRAEVSDRAGVGVNAAVFTDNVPLSYDKVVTAYRAEVIVADSYNMDSPVYLLPVVHESVVAIVWVVATLVGAVLVLSTRPFIYFLLFVFFTWTTILLGGCFEGVFTLGNSYLRGVCSSTTSGGGGLEHSCTSYSSFLVHRYRIDNEGYVIYILSKVVDSLRLSRVVVAPLLSFGRGYGAPTLFCRAIGRHIMGSLRVDSTRSFRSICFCLSSNFTTIFVSNISGYLILKVRNFRGEKVSSPTARTGVGNTQRYFARALGSGGTALRHHVGAPTLGVGRVGINERIRASITVYCVGNVTDRELIRRIRRHVGSTGVSHIYSCTRLTTFLNDSINSIFSTCKAARHPSALYSGLCRKHIAILISNSPFTICIPYLFASSFSAISSCSGQPICTDVGHLLGCFSFIVSIILPKLCITINAFRRRLLPASLVCAVTTTRVAAPFSLVRRTIVVVVLCRVVHRTKLHLPHTVKRTISVVNTLIVNSTIMGTKLINTPVLIIITIATVSSCIVCPLCRDITILELKFVVLNNCANVCNIILKVYILYIGVATVGPCNIPCSTPVSPLGGGDVNSIFCHRG